jgi:hypothetical protein
MLGCGGDGRYFEPNTGGRSAEQRGLGTTTALTLDFQGSLKLQCLLWPDHECDYKGRLLPDLEDRSGRSGVDGFQPFCR